MVIISMHSILHVDVHLPYEKRPFVIFEKRLLLFRLLLGEHGKDDKYKERTGRLVSMECKCVIVPCKTSKAETKTIS